MNDLTPSEISEKLQSLMPPKQPKGESRKSNTSIGINFVLPALLAGILLGAAGHSILSPGLSKAQQEWVVFEIAEKYGIVPDAASALITAR